VTEPLRRTSPVRIGKVFQTTPLAVVQAFQTFDTARAAILQLSRTRQTIADYLLAHRHLERTVWEEARVRGYFVVAGNLVGYSGPRGDRKFTVTPAAWPLEPEKRP